MIPMLMPDTVLKATPWCVVREQEEQYLVYNSHTDELHLLPPTGFYAYRLCNGLITIDEIRDELSASMAEDQGALADGLCKFFEMLLARGIVEIET